MIQCKMFLSCGELEPELSKLDQFLVGKISKLLGPLNACPPCTYFSISVQDQFRKLTHFETFCIKIQWFMTSPIQPDPIQPNNV